MIRRSRPKYLEGVNINITMHEQEKLSNGFYFDRGSSALRFLLERLQAFYDKELTVCMQAFNCSSVMDAALKVENLKVILSDVKLEDFSISLEFLKENVKEIDVLLLLHYQGKINLEYKQIIDFCKNNEIIVIEDLAHIAESGFAFKGDYGIYSYSFDKPFTCFSGGKIVFKSIQNEFLFFFEDAYRKLELENIKKTKLDFKMLEYFVKYTTEDLYSPRIDNQQISKSLLRILPVHFVYTLQKNRFLELSFRIFFKVLFRLFPEMFKRTYTPLRISDNKVRLIEAQRQNYFNFIKDYKKIQDEIIDALNNKHGFAIDKDTIWNRLSFIDENKKLQLNNIEYANYNWSVPLNESYKNNKDVILIGNYDNTKFLSQNIINFPIWSKRIINII